MRAAYLEFIEISEIVIDIYNINSEIIFSYNNDFQKNSRNKNFRNKFFIKYFSLNI